MIIAFLNKPYPYLGNFKRNLVVNFFIGCFIAFFLIVFQPFDINQWVTSNKTLKLLGFGFVSFAVPLLISAVIAVSFSRKLLEDNWRVWTEILNIAIILLFIALGNMLYANLLGATSLTLKNYFGALATVLLIGIFPVTLHVITKHNRLLKINLEKAAQVNQHLDEPVKEQHIEQTQLVLTAENEKDKIILHPARLLFIESADNYSNVVYSENGIIKKQLIRGSLKRIEQQISFPKIKRCHRAYIVNLDNVEKVEGNAAGYRLHLTNCTIAVPVSRSFSTTILRLLNHS